MKPDILLKDLRVAEYLARLIMNGERGNREVVSRNYLIPKTTGLVLPLKHPDGEYMHYLRIRDGLEMLIKFKVSTIGFMQTNPPDYVKGAVY